MLDQRVAEGAVGDAEALAGLSLEVGELVAVVVHAMVVEGRGRGQRSKAEVVAPKRRQRLGWGPVVTRTTATVDTFRRGA
jgi:hypothetical protein